jgi:hypothetical protein
VEICPETYEIDAAQPVKMDFPAIYNIHGTILIRDAVTPGGVRSLANEPRMRRRLASRAFGDSWVKTALSTEYIVLACVARVSHVDAASVLLRYVSNFTLFREGEE